MKKSNRLNIACVVPRYGASIGGGAETLIRELVLGVFEKNILPDFEVEHIEVWTTCASNHRTWENDLTEGVYTEGRVVIRRFPVDERDLESFIHSEHSLANGSALSIEQQINWLDSGVNSSLLYNHIRENQSDFDFIIFAPYLFPVTFWGANIAPEKSVIIPCLHDESYAYLKVFQYLFSRVAGVFFNAQAERELAKELYSLDCLEEKSFVIGMGFSDEDRPHESGIRSKPYLLYSGRKECGKNLDLLIECFSEYRKADEQDDLELVLIGSGEIEFLQKLPEGVVDLGFVSEKEKLGLMGDALALCQPSVNESFSIVLMESWLRGTPVIVHSDCSVTSEHALNSGGGLVFRNREEFIEAVRRIRNCPELRSELGRAGLEYVKREYSWSAVSQRLNHAFQRLAVKPLGESSQGQLITGNAPRK